MTNHLSFSQKIEKKIIIYIVLITWCFSVFPDTKKQCFLSHVSNTCVYIYIVLKIINLFHKYLVLFQTYKQQQLQVLEVKPPSTYVTISWLFHWKSEIYGFNKLWLKQLKKCLQFHEHCFRRFHMTKVLMNKFLIDFFKYLS